MDFRHEAVRHSREFVRDQAHANGIESFRAMRKSGDYGAYHRMSEKHLNRCVTKFAGAAQYPQSGHCHTDSLNCQRHDRQAAPLSGFGGVSILSPQEGHGMGGREQAVPAVNATGTGRRIARRSSVRRSKRLIAFGWYGGKFSHLDFILPHIPPDALHFCDVYGGSAAVLLNLPPYPVETYNDLDSELVNFFHTLRNQGAKLMKAISLTPFSREELVRACEPEEGLSRLERARRFYVRARQTRTGLAQKSSRGRWAHCVLTSRAGMAGAVSRWLGSVEGLPEVVQRLQRIQIENAPALDVIRRYDTAETVFYLDPSTPCAEIQQRMAMK